ncbi:LLM class flavin-dependent oxidoreductase [Actinomadura meridiana]|uniref:LLM class flavin-dependent oxidoreductase n=1 Tax=Actinomadura meridiana TaxID=559626 RepID=A0ABP8BT56_9ACTN
MHVYAVTPQAPGPDDTSGSGYAGLLAETADACERAGWSGILVPHNLHEVDPWLITGQLGQAAERLVPLVAVQPASAPPHTVAAMAAAFAVLYGRPLDFNLVAGAREDERRQTGDLLDHDERYARLREYGMILRALLRGEEVTMAGRFYSYDRFRLVPRPDVLSRSRLFVAGSSPASISVAQEIADVVVTHPTPFAEWSESFLKPLVAGGYTGGLGIRVGVVADSRRERAWTEAERRFPETWQGRQETLLKTVSSNRWARDLAVRSVDAQERPDRSDPYWLGAFRSGKASAPFFVGTHEEVGERLGDYVRAGIDHILLNGCHEADYHDIGRAIAIASKS